MPSRSRPMIALAAVVAMLGLAASTRGLAQSDTPELQLQRARTFYGNGQFLDALPIFTQAALAEAEAVRVPATLGVLQSALRVARFDVARSAAVSLRRERPDDPEVRAFFGDAMWASGLFAEADAAYHEAFAIDVNNARAHNGLARVLSARVRHQEALEHALTAIRLAPQESDFHHTVGSVYARLGRYADAAAAYERFMRLLPKGEQDDRAVWTKSTIKQLRAFGDDVPNQFVAGGDQVHVIPFRLVNEKVVVTARINRGPDQEFVIDTGAEMATVSRRTAERQGVNAVAFTVSAGVGEVGLRGLQIGRIEALELAGLKLRNVPCIIKSPALVDLPTPERESLSPLALGLSMAVDYQRRTITLAKHLPADAGPADATMPLWLTRLATVRGMVGDGHPRSFVVDTGGQVISISTETARALPTDATVRKIALKVYGASGWDRDAYLLPGVDLAFNDLRFNRLSVVVLNLRAPSVLLGYDLGGIVGHQFLSRYHVSLDLERAELRLRKVALQP